MIFSPSIRNLRYLSPCSVLANIFEFVGLAVIAYYIFGTPLPRFDTDEDVIGDDDDKNYAEPNPKVSENDIACKNRISENRAARLERFFQIFTDFDVTKFFKHSFEQNCLAQIEKFGQLHPDVAQKHKIHKP